MFDISHTTTPSVSPLNSAATDLVEFGRELPDSDSPENLAHELTACIRSGAEAIIRAGEIASYAMRTFPAGSPPRGRFFISLVEQGFLSEAEARAEGQSSKISKLCAIGEHSNFLRQKNILCRLSPGYSNFYQAVLLLREVRKHSAQAEETMASLLDGANGDVNREFLVKTRKALKKRSANDPASTEGGTDSTTAQIDFSSPAELVLLTPKKADLRLFTEDYSDPDALSAFHLNRMVAPGAIAVCIADVRDLPVVMDRLLPLSGFKYIKKVRLTSIPASSDITQAKVAIVACRANNALPNEIEPWDFDVLDERALAVQAAPNAAAKLHAFATDTADGWTCLSGSNVWSEMPSLKGAA